jgi:cation transport regulator ChaB
MERATSSVVYLPRRKKLTVKEARELALSILKDAEASRMRFAEEEAAHGTSWEELS